MDQILISTDKDALDIDYINGFISNSYWAKGRTIETMQTCIDNSLNFGVYLKGKQIGYARLITDYARFAYIMDLFIDEAHRGKGYAKELMKYMLELDAMKNVKFWRLATTDAHELYKKFGFTALAKPEQSMELNRR